MTRLLAALVLVSLPLVTFAQSIFDRLILDDPHGQVPLSITLPLDSILGRENKETDASLIFTDNQGVEQHWTVKVNARGKFRRARCEMPPLKLNFSKKELRAAGLRDYDKYKLVLPCFGNAFGEELVIKEYLAYQAYHLVTPISYRTQLLHLTVHDSNGGADHTVTAFIIEDTDQMAERNGAEEIDDIIGQPAEAYDAEAEVTHALVQYMVGNGDWSLLLGRNVKMLRLPTGKFAPVGYDFDFTGWVGAPYASAVSDVGQKSIYERVYLGYAHKDDVIDRGFLQFKEQRRAMLQLINGSGLSPDAKTVTYRFAARFFSAINRMNGTRDLSVYDQLRGDTASVIPSGEFPESFQNTAR